MQTEGRQSTHCSTQAWELISLQHRKHSMHRVCFVQASRRAKQQARRSAQFDQLVIRRGDLTPGSVVSVDQCASTTLGRLPHTRGHESDHDGCHRGTITVDHASQCTFVHNQVSLTVGETLKAKTAFEQLAESHGHKVKHCRADNAPFGAKAFRDNIELNGQTIDCSGVGAHHQNGVAERAIMTVTQWARSMIMHAILMWPDQSQNAVKLWPFALEHAAHIWNDMPRRDSRIAPVELFTNEKLTDNEAIARLHVWGMPSPCVGPQAARRQEGSQIERILGQNDVNENCGHFILGSHDQCLLGSCSISLGLSTLHSDVHESNWITFGSWMSHFSRGSVISHSLLLSHRWLINLLLS